MLKRSSFGTKSDKSETPGGVNSGNPEIKKAPPSRFIEQLAEVVAADRPDVEAFLEANPDHRDMPLWLVLEYLGKRHTTTAPINDTPHSANAKAVGGLRNPLGKR